VGGFLILYSFPLIFWVDGVTSLLAAVVLTITLTHYSTHEQTSDADWKLWKAMVRDRRLILFLCAVVIIFTTIFQYFSTIPYVCVHELGLPASAYGLLFIVNTLLIVTIEVPLNLAMSKWHHHHSLALGALFTAVGFGAMLFVSGFWGVVIIIVIWTFGEMIFVPSSSAYVADIAAPERRGMYMGIFQMAGNVAFTLSGWMGMKILESFGSAVLWIFLFGICIVAALLTLSMRAPQSAHG
jgi:predicted MFS family arabinose efflux permease